MRSKLEPMAKRAAKKSVEIDVPTWLKGLPKVELHLHLEGTILPATLLELSQRHDSDPLTAEDARKLYIYANFLGFMASFKEVSARLKGPDDYELITYNMVRELAAQGVVHAEVYISFGIIYFWKNADVEPYVEAIERGRIRAEKSLAPPSTGSSTLSATSGQRRPARSSARPPTARAIPQHHRHWHRWRRGPWLRRPLSRELCRGQGCRPPANRPCRRDRGRESGAASIWSAINIGAERIGHALAAQYDPELLEVLATRQIPLELNITSNIRTGSCPDFDQHPVRDYFNSGLMVTINSDDPPMFGSNLLEEYILAHDKFGFTLDHLRELAANAVEASFLPPERKLALLRAVELYNQGRASIAEARSRKVAS